MKLFDKLFPWLCTLVAMALMADAGLDRWEAGDREGGAELWISMLPVGIVMLVLIFTGQTIDSKSTIDTEVPEAEEVPEQQH